MPTDRLGARTQLIAITSTLFAGTAAIASPLLAVAKRASSPPPAVSRIDFATGTLTAWADDGPPQISTEGDAGAGVDGRSTLPQTAPSLPSRGSRFSTLLRARDVVDASAYPARVVAKLYQLDAGGKRQGTTCTAQFVGSRHLLTAAHCLMDRTVGKPKAGFEVAIRFDDGRHHGVLPVVAGWLPTTMTTVKPSVIRATGSIDWAAECHDVALIEVEQPTTARLGWLGMSSMATPGAILHRFSYPNESAVAATARHARDETQPKEVRDHLLTELVGMRRIEPDFSPDNPYYGYGPVDQIHSEALSERTGAVLPGRSGSALVDANGHALAVMSRAVLGVNYSCRLTPQMIGVFGRIAASREL